MSWTARLLVALVLILAGAAAATWGLAHYRSAARFLGVVPAETPVAPGAALPQGQSAQGVTPAQSQPAPAPAPAAEIAELKARLQRLENETREAQGSAGRADALLIAVAARRAIDRGVALGYLEPLLVSRFGTSHPQAVATIVTASRSPVRLSELIAGYQDLQTELLGPPPNEDMWTGFKRGLSSLISLHRSDRPSSQPQARFERALAHLTAGEVDSALAETMRLPGAPRARDWIASARQYVAVHRALDEVETAALMGNQQAR
ncbi:MAG TPA: hypothetical protein VFO51_03065 [Sphingomicrobium sp.]|nr:hypothetical protein [Sphingomicrobium sp.]